MEKQKDDQLIQAINHGNVVLNANILEHAIKHGLTGLLYEKVRGGNADPELVIALRRQYVTWQGIALLRAECLQQLLADCKNAGVSLVLMKGVALGYQVYSTPGLRPCMDIDLLITKTDESAVKRIFTNLGYQIDQVAADSVINYQFIATREVIAGHTVMFDVHVKLNNQIEYARLLDYNEVLSRSVVLEEVDQHAHALNLVDALLLSCIHIQGHAAQYEPIKLIWLYDIKCLIDHFDEALQRQFVQVMREKSLSPICAKWIKEAAVIFLFHIPEIIDKSFENVRMQSGPNPIQVLWNQFYYQRGAKNKLRFARELFAPPKEYLQNKYPDSNLWLPILYLRRAMAGLFDRVRKMISYR